MPRRSGFTLLELLAVVAVIMLLMGLLTAALLKSQDAMKRRKAEIGAAAIVSAIASYRSFYKEFPAPAGNFGKGKTYAVGSTAIRVILEMLIQPPLVGGRQSPPLRNLSDFLYDSDGNAINLWRKPFEISLDLDSDGKIDGSPKEVLVTSEME